MGQAVDAPPGRRVVDIEEAKRMRRAYAAERAAECDRAAEAQRRAAAFGQLIEGLETLFPSITEDSTEPESDPQPKQGSGVTEATRDYPRGKEAVLAILSDRPGEWFMVREIVTELSRRGWLGDYSSPENAVRAAIARAMASGGIDVERFDGRTLRYRIPLKVTEPEPEEDPPAHIDHAGTDQAERDQVALEEVASTP